jgi:hypothetical protein
VLFPLHNSLVLVGTITSEEGCVMVTLAVVVHPLASVTVTEYVPAGNPLIDDALAPLLQE